LNDRLNRSVVSWRLDPYLLLVVVTSAVAALPLLGPYFVGSHDGVLAVYRFFEFDRSIQDGILIPRWAPDLFFGYGYPFFNFYAPLSYYVAEVFHHLGAGFAGSVSATFALGFVLSGATMYLLAKDLGGRWAGLLASLAYVFAPYHLVNAHLRGDMAEFFAFVWFPAILWAAGRLIARRSLGYLALTAVLYAALLTTHNIMALAFSPLLAAYMVFLLLRSRRTAAFGRGALYAALAIVLAFGLSAFFWLPALQQVSEIQIERLNIDPSFYFRTSLMRVSSYISGSFLQNYGPRTAGGDYGYPVELGRVQVILAVAGAVLVAWRWRRRRQEGLPHLAFMGVAASVYYAIMFPWSLFLWETVPLMSYLQSPWRLLPFLILFASLLIGVFGRWAAGLRPAWAGTAALVLLALLVTVPNIVSLQPRYVDLRETDVSVGGTLRFEVLSQNIGMTAAGEYLPKGVRARMAISPLAVDAVSNAQPPARFDPAFLAGGAEVDLLESTTILGRFRVRSPEGTPFLFNQTYFSGWEATIDGHPATLKGIGTANLMAVDVPSGQHDLEFRFQDTRVRLLGKGISLISLLLVLALLGLHLARRQSPQPTTEQPLNDHRITSEQPSNNHRITAYSLLLVPIITAALLVPRLAGPAPAAGAAFPVDAAWSGGPVLTGYSLNSATVRPGETLELTLFWKLPPQGLQVRLGLKGPADKTWGQKTVDGPAPGPDGGLTRDLQRFELPADLPPGQYRITMDVLNGGKPLPIQEEKLARAIFPEKSLLLGPVFVSRAEGEARAIAGARMYTGQVVELEGKAALLGYNADISGRSLVVTTYWTALSTMWEDYSVFAHLADRSDRALLMNDLQPWANPYPTTLWKEGDLVSVPFHFDLPADFAPEEHHINVGLYTPDNFHRLSVLDATGFPITNTISISLTAGSIR